MLFLGNRRQILSISQDNRDFSSAYNQQNSEIKNVTFCNSKCHSSLSRCNKNNECSSMSIYINTFKKKKIVKIFNLIYLLELPGYNLEVPELIF